MSKGRRKPHLRDVSREHPNEQEIDALYDTVHDSHPIVTAILGAALVEYELEYYLRHRLLNPRHGSLKERDEIWTDLTEENGPLGTLYRKILVGQTLRLYEAAVTHNLHIMRNIAMLSLTRKN